MWEIPHIIIKKIATHYSLLLVLYIFLYPPEHLYKVGIIIFTLYMKK